MLAEILISLSIQSQNPDLNQEYIDTAKQYRIAYPADWTLNKGRESISLTAPVSPTNDAFQEIFFIHVQKADDEVRTLKDYVEKSLNDIRSVMGDTAIIEMKDVKFLNQACKELNYEMLYEQSLLKIRQHVFKHGDTFYLFTYTSTPQEFTQFVKVADQMRESFSFIKNK